MWKFVEAPKLMLQNMRKSTNGFFVYYMYVLKMLLKLKCKRFLKNNFEC